METLIIYDNSGYVLMQQTGAFRTPEGGVNYIITKIPSGMKVGGVNVETKEPILEEMEPTENEILKKEIEKLKSDIADLTLEVAMGGM